MKTAQYTLTSNEISQILTEAKRYFSKHSSDYKKHPDRYVDCRANLVTQWRHLSMQRAKFHQLVRNELASITKVHDEDTSFEDTWGVLL